jgi:hypothetical protein
MGIPGVVLYMEDGMGITTDNNGQYSFCGLKPITHVIRVDERTMPDGSVLGEVDARNSGNASSRFVDVKDGELHRADFREIGCSTSVVRAVRAKVGQNEAREANEKAVRRNRGKGMVSEGGLIPEGKGDAVFRSQEERGCEEGDDRVVCQGVEYHEKVEEDVEGQAKAKRRGSVVEGVEMGGGKKGVDQVKGGQLNLEGKEVIPAQEVEESDIPESKFVSPEEQRKLIQQTPLHINME